MRVGVVGLGWAGREHLQSLASLPAAVIAGVTDADPAAASAAAEAANTRAYASVDELLDGAALDVLVVATPAGAHAEAAVAALSRGVAVYLEKPLARSLADAQAIVEASARHGVPCAVGYQWRAVAAIDRLRQELLGQDVGLLVSRGVGITQARAWFHDDTHSAGLLSERGCHHIDLHRYLAGTVVSVQATRGGVPLSGHVDADGVLDDLVCLLLTFASGAVGVIAVAWTPPDLPGAQELTVVASEGSFQAQLDPEFVVYGTSRGRAFAARSERHPFVASLEDFLQAVRAGTPETIRSDARDAAETLVVERACEVALGSGETVSVVPLEQLLPQS